MSHPWRILLDMEPTPSQIGERAEAEVIAALTRMGTDVWLPFRASSRVDLMFEDDVGVHRVQCKAGFRSGDVVIFMTCSNTRNVPRSYRGQVDYFGVFCAAVGDVYLVPVADVPEHRGYLRLAPPRNGQTKGVRWAADYRI